MCTNPQKIRNRFCNTIHYRTEFGEIVEVPTHLYSHREYIDVPCGKCAECRSTYIQSLYQRAYVESLSSYVYFVTLTYDNEHLPSVYLPSGRLVYYADYSHITSMFDRFRKNFKRAYRYLCVNEYGDTNFRPHFHILLFVAKETDDDKLTPYRLEDFIRSNLCNYFSINKGTRKNPIYQKLFRFAYRYVGGKLYTNYFVKFVVPDTSNSQHISFEHTIVLSKTIRYLINYVNKGSRFDSVVESDIDIIEDENLRMKLRNMLSCKVRFSKGFGCGFCNGQRVDLPIISHRLSQLDVLYHSLKIQYNIDFDTFKVSHPKLYYQLLDFVDSPPYSLYDTVEQFTQNAPSYQVKLHLLLLHFDPKTFNRLYRQYFVHTRPYISYFFQFLSPSKYCKKLIQSTLPEYSDTFAYIRKCVDSGISAHVPFLSFVDFATQTYYTLCDYYKCRCTTMQDFDDLLRVCGFANYDDWTAHFTHYINSKKYDKAVGNLTLPTEFVQRNCVSSHTLTDLYSYFYT